MISYRETQAAREAKAAEADKILADYAAADRAAMARLIDRGHAPRQTETPEQFLRRIGYKKD